MRPCSRRGFLPVAASHNQSAHPEQVTSRLPSPEKAARASSPSSPEGSVFHTCLPVAVSNRVSTVPFSPPRRRTAALASGDHTQYSCSPLRGSRRRRGLPVSTSQSWTVPAPSSLISVLPSSENSIQPASLTPRG